MKSALSFKKSVTLTLPQSCIEVELQKPDIARLAMENADSGVIPEPLVHRMTNAINHKETSTNWQPTEKDLPGLSKFMDMVVRAAFRWPMIVRENPDYEAGQILISDLDMQDRMFVFEWAMPTDFVQVDSFRSQQVSNVETPSDVQSLRTTSKRSTKHRG